MSRPKKDSKPLNINLAKGLYDRLAKYADDLGQTKTMAVERILKKELDEYDKRQDNKVNIG